MKPINNYGTTAMTTTTISNFRREFVTFRQNARREPVEITRHGQRALVLMSAEHYDWIRAAGRRAHRTSNTTAVVINTVKRADMDPEHDALDELLR
jgi:prevent-host-death family protein